MPSSIDEETYAQADQKLPDTSQLKKILNITPDIISINIDPNSPLPIAAACFQDMRITLLETRYALLESLAHKVWFLEKKKPPDELTAIFFSRFYADDAALRLYSAAEHLAKAVVYIFNIDDNQIKENKSGSRFGKVRKLLRKADPEHPISKAIDAVYTSKAWKKTIRYRDDWVHQQPPLIKGLVLVYERKIRWERSENGKTLTLGGGGDEARYSIDDVLGFLCPALSIFIEKAMIIVEFYISELNKDKKVFEIHEDPPTSTAQL
jgi:hypothetical protein